MKIPAVLSLAALALSLCASSASAHECKVVCDAAHSAPVCGSDGKTYASQCFLEFAKCETPKLTVAHEGACPSTKKKAKKIHISISSTQRKKETRDADDDEDEDEDEDEADEEDEHDTKKKVAATKKNKCEKDCTREFEQLCASDGKTYNNHCLFEIALCYNASLTIKDEDGACPTPVLTATQKDEEEEEDSEEDEEEEEKKEDKCLKGCTREYDPLCASDGKTYNNHCLFEIALCRDSKLTVTDADGPCTKK